MHKLDVDQEPGVLNRSKYIYPGMISVTYTQETDVYDESEGPILGKQSYSNMIP
jgi:hypothetical protein